MMMTNTQNNALRPLQNGLISGTGNEMIDNDKGLHISGMTVSDTGFRCQRGYRDFEQLRIVEETADGTGISFFNSIKVFYKQGNKEELLSDHAFPQGTRYSRQTARNKAEDLVFEAIQRSIESSGQEVDQAGLLQLVRQKLDKAYFERSDAAAIELIKSWGINLH